LCDLVARIYNTLMAKTPRKTASTKKTVPRSAAAPRGATDTPATNGDNGEWAEYGKLFRTLREERGYSLRQVARDAQVSPGVVSKFERGQVSPTFVTAHRLLNVLGLSVSEFFGATHVGIPQRTAAVFPADGVKTVVSGGESLTWLLPVGAHLACQMFLEVWQPGTTRTESETLMGDLVGFVLEGELTILVPQARGKGWKEMVARAGEAFYIPAGVPHRTANRGKTTTRFLDLVLGAGKAAF
jgi:ribosome-binding protein aMBF1 (putative translation factor)